MTIAGRPRRRFLAVFAGLLAITAIVGWGLHKRSEYQTAKEQAAIQRIEAVGGQVVVATEYPLYDCLPNWMLRWGFLHSIAISQGYEYPSKIFFIRVPVTDEEFRALRIEDLPSVSILAISKTKMTGQCLIEVAKLPDLDFVSLQDIEIQDTDLNHLSGLHSLWSLGLKRTSIRGQGLAGLATHFPDLRYLALDDTLIMDAELQHLRRFASLTDLRLCGTQITENGFKELHGFSGLRVLDLARVKSTNSENMRVLFETLRNCHIRFSDWSNPCPQCGCSAIRSFDPHLGDRSFFTCRHVQKVESLP
jgi:hypothetical protein